MDWLEEELKRSLAREEPPPGFADRVQSVVRPRQTFATRRWMAAAAALAVMAGSGGFAYRQYEGIKAKNEVMLAMRISAAKLNHIQKHMREVRQ